MGKAFSNTQAQQVGTVSPYGGQQLGLLNEVINQAQGGLGQTDISQNPAYQQAVGALGQFLQPDQEALQNQFQSQFVEPSLQTFQQQVIPTIQQKYATLGAGRSSGINQALAQSAENLQTTLGGQLQNLIQQTQQNQLGAAGQLGSLSQLPSQNILNLLGLALTPSQTPIIQPGQQGWGYGALGGLASGLGSGLGGFLGGLL